MSNPLIKDVNVETGEQVEREMTSEELSEYKKTIQLQKSQKNDLEAKESARKSALDKLAALGLTEAEIQALAG